jgi:hypothetical protein
VRSWRRSTTAVVGRVGASWQPFDLGVDAFLGGIASGGGVTVFTVTELRSETDHRASIWVRSGD